tara:strand:- start:40 stop:594 length:555 start_codon:yes stop_codon:yes gene_type:complete
MLATKTALTLEAARTIAAACDKEARSRALKLVIAIVDDGGHLVLLHRDDNAQVGSVEIAKLKARYGFVAELIITDKLLSYGAAKADRPPGLVHRSHKGLNKRAENSHLPSKARTNNARPPVAGSAATVCFHAFGYPQLLFSSTRRRATQTIRCHRLEAGDGSKRRLASPENLSARAFPCMTKLT